MTGIFFGSSTGNTEALAQQIAKKLGVASSDIHNVADTPAGKVAGYDCLLLGSSTWGAGDLQDDWYDFLEKLKKQDLAGKNVGVFGCGDSASYPDTFCDALGLICRDLESTGCVFVGEMDGASYPVRDSLAFVGDKVCGLAVDDDEPAETDARLNRWVEALKNA